MVEIADEIQRKICEAYRTGRGLALFSDYDGTLAPLRPTPEEAVMPPPVRKAMQRLATLQDVTIGAISGRAIENLKSMVAIDSIFYAGTSGMEIEMAGRRQTIAATENSRKSLEGITERLQSLTRQFAGSWIEQKPFGLTLHYRAVKQELADSLKKETLDALSPWAKDFRAADVTRGIEIVPQVGRDKGTAVREMLAEVGGNPFCVYLGDAANDEPAFAVVQELGGLSVGVGPEAPPTEYRVNGPEDISLLLTMLALELVPERPAA